MKRIILLAVAALLAMPCIVSAQSAKEARAITKEHKVISKLSEKELNAKASKAASKESKKLKKEGWVVSPGGLPLDRQLDRSYKMQYEYEEGGYPKYIMADAMSIGENYDAAKMQAIELAKMNLASQIQTEITALVESTVANRQLGQGEAASITETVNASKNLISQRLGRVLPVMECYRNTRSKNKEVLVRLAYNSKMALESAKQVVREQLEEKGVKLHNQLDEVLGF